MKAAKTIGVYGAVDIFLIHELPKFAKSYMVNDKRAVKEGLMRRAPKDAAPRNMGIGYQSGFKKTPTRLLTLDEKNLVAADSDRPLLQLTSGFAEDSHNKEDLLPLPAPRVVLFRHRKSGSSWVAEYIEKLLREDKADSDAGKEPLKSFIALDEALSARVGAVQALKEAGVLTVTSIRHPIARYLSEAHHCGPLARCSGEEFYWANVKDHCPEGYPENLRKNASAEMWDQWREAGQLGCPLTGTTIVSEECVNGTTMVTVNGSEAEVSQRCRDTAARWPRALYVDNYFTRRMMGDPACNATQRPVTFAAYDAESLKSAEPISAFFGDQKSLLCEMCPDCGCAMMRQLTSRDLEAAKAALEATDIVVVEEEPDQVRAQFDYHFGSSVQKEITQATIEEEASRTNNAAFEHQAPSSSDETMTQVYREHDYDLQLWEYAKNLTRSREAAARRMLKVSRLR